MRSMTGIGTGKARQGDLALHVELRSVNHRFLDLAMRLPSAFAEFEADIRTRLQAEIERGRVNVALEFERPETSLEVSFHAPFVRAFVEEARRIAKEFGLNDDLGVRDLAQLDEAFQVREQEIPEAVRRSLLDAALGDALASFQSMRENEGAKLGKDLLRRVDVIEQQLQVVRGRAALVPQELKRKLTERIERMGASDVVDPQRIAAEVALLVDRATVEEEIERMESHLAQFRETVRTVHPAAKRLGFLLQEMHREINTTGSKSTDLEITGAVLRMKEEVENLREQIANLE